MLEVHSLLAQALPPTTPIPPLTDLLAQPDKWLTDMFNAALVNVGKKAVDQIAGFMDWLVRGGNIITRTPAELSYKNAVLLELWVGMCTIANAALLAIAAWGGLNIIVQPHIRAPYHGALELVPRLVLSGIMLNNSRSFCQFVIELNNEFCGAISNGSMPGWITVQQQMPNADSVLLSLIAIAIYLVMGLLLTGQMLMRLALVDVLLVVAPMALLCWVLPQTYSWARLWFSTFFATVFVQTIQVLVLRLGTGLIQELPTLLKSIGADPVQGWRAWLMTLLLGIAVLQLARKVPRLMPGYPVAAGLAYTGPNVVRQITSVFNSASSKKGGK